MLFFIRKAEFRKNGGSLNFNIANLTGETDATQNAYLAVVKQKFPPIPGFAPWARMNRYGLVFLNPNTPNWNTDGTRYWANMYYRAAANDIMSSRRIMLEPICWLRQKSTDSFQCRPNASPNFFGRNNSTDVQVIDDASNQWRLDIRWQLRTLLTENIGTSGGEPWLTQVKFTNMNVAMVLGPNEIDAWVNARLYYAADAECSGGSAPDEATRAGVANLAGTAGLSRLLLRLRDHLRHYYEWMREFRPDIGVACASVIQTNVDRGTREFTIYELLKFTNSGSGLTAQGNINDVCDVHQFHNHQRQWIIPDFWAGSTSIANSQISAYHYWTAQQQVQAWRASNGLPDNTRPLIATEVGSNYFEEGAVTAGRTDLHQLRSLRYGELVIGPLFWGCCMVHFYSVGLSPQAGQNVIENNAYFVDNAGKADADYVAVIEDWRETTDDIPFVAKGWQDFWDPRTWVVGFLQQQDPIDGGPSVCPFVEWNRVSMPGSVVTMSPGGRNHLVRKKNLRRGEHVFSAEIKLDNANSRACVSAHGYDKLNGLAVARSTVLVGVNDWTTVSVSFTPRQHGNPRVPDPATCVLMIDHNGTGTCQVRNPKILMPGTSTVSPPANNYYNFAITDIGWTPATPGVGSGVVFSATVTNTGNTVSPGGIINGIRFRVDGVNQTYCDNDTTSFAVGEARVLTANNSYVTPGTNTWVATSGTHTIEATFDDLNRFTEESSKTDNVMSETLTVTATDQYFDIIVTGMSMSPATPKAGDAVRFSGTIKNNGTAASPSGIIHGLKFGVDNVTVSWSDNNSTSLAPGESRTQAANGGPNSNGGLWTSVAGSHNLLMTFDDVNRMTSERDKTNNTLTVPFSVASTSPQPTDHFLGVFVNDPDLGGGAPWTASVIDNWVTLTGPSKVKLWHWYIPMGYVNANNEMTVVDSKGYTPYISIGSSTGVDPYPSVAWTDISAGTYDSVIDRLAGYINTFGKQVVLQYDWEMNLKSGTAAEFIAAHQRLVTRIRAITSLAKFHWCPASIPGNPEFTAYWPGDPYVDYAGFNSYNWGDHFASGAWATPQEVFGPSYDSVRTMTDKPMWIGETGCAPGPGDKAAWIKSAYNDVIPNSYPYIQAVVYFHENGVEGVDWRITTPTTATQAWKDVQSNTFWGSSVVPPPVTISPPAQASNAGLTRLHWHDEFDTLSLWHATNNPTGTWRCTEAWMTADSPGYVNIGGNRGFLINQNYPDPVLQPYLPLSISEPSVLRIRATRARLSERPALRTLVNNIARQQDPVLVDAVTWLGAMFTTYVTGDFQPALITRPAYIEGRFRWAPANVNRGAEAFWLFEPLDGTGHEIDLFENGYGDYTIWETNLHQTGSGPDYSVLFDQRWRDGNWHIIGMLWQASGLTLYYDNVVAHASDGINPITNSVAQSFSAPLRLLLNVCGSTYLYDSYGVPDNNPTEYFDMYVDYIRVWKA